MTLLFLLYLTGLLHSIDLILGFSCFIGILSFAITIFLWCVSDDGYHKEWHAQIDKLIKFLIKKSWIIIIIIFIDIFIPTKETMYLILGTKYLADSNIPSQVSEILGLKLKDIITELKKDKKND